MDQLQIDNLARTWISNVEKFGQLEESVQPNIDIPMHDLDRMVFHDAENAWLVIDSARRMAKDDLMLANIAAGPLEALLWKHGEKFIDRFEALAKKDEHFAFLMTGVWIRDDMSEDLVTRIKAIASLTQRHL